MDELKDALTERAIQLHTQRVRDFPLFCPKCKRESIINARSFQIELADQPGTKTHIFSA